MKLACVVQRFGAEVTGGSERHCRVVAEHLAAHHDVTILTSCAQDYVTWRNVYPPGVSRNGALTVHRFAAARERNLGRLAALSDIVFTTRSSPAEQEEWFVENGPEVPGLIEHLRQHGREYDRVLFWTYRYYQTYFGLPLVADRAILVPTAEEDPLIWIDALDRFFALPSGYLFLTPEEARLVQGRASRPLPPSAVIGCGVDPVPAHAGGVDLAPLGISDPFVLYLGRIEPNKGCETLLEYFDRYLGSSSPAGLGTPRLSGTPQESRGSPGPTVQLVMAGFPNMPIPDHPAIKCLGVVDEPLREALLAKARLLLVPSPFESLSMVLLEAWNQGLPALVNGRCAVLHGQVVRANGGLSYRYASDFAASLAYLLEHPDVARQLGRQGQAYVEQEYRWPHVMRKVEDFLQNTGRHP
jgi:glycosyltransferase involved in cell wall biosynthesis